MTSILAKIGIKGVNSNLATAIHCKNLSCWCTYQCWYICNAMETNY